MARSSKSRHKSYMRKKYGNVHFGGSHMGKAGRKMQRGIYRKKYDSR